MQSPPSRPPRTAAARRPATGPGRRRHPAVIAAWLSAALLATPLAGAQAPAAGLPGAVAPAAPAASGTVAPGGVIPGGVVPGGVAPGGTVPDSATQGMGAPAAAPATVPGAAPAVPPPGATGRVERSIGSTPPPVPGSPLGAQPGTMPAPRGFAVPPATAPSPVPAPAPVPVPPGVPPMTVPPAPPAAARVPVLPTVPTPPVTGLPPDAPKLVINGGVYSPRREHRIVIVNGQIVREGADLGSGVLLEQIRPTSVVLAFRGTRYNVNY